MDSSRTPDFLKFESLLSADEVFELNEKIESRLKGVLHIDELEVKSFIIPKQQFSELNLIFGKSVVKDLISKKNLIIENAYLADQNIISKTSKILGEVPYISHTDRNRRQKIFIYLTNCNETDGPIWIRDQPINALAGDMVFFDTDTPHFAGPAQLGSKRRVIRLDCYNISDVRADDYLFTLSYKLSQKFSSVYRLIYIVLKRKFPARAALIKTKLLNKLTS